MFDRFVQICLVVFVIGCCVAWPGKGKWGNNYTLFGSIITTVALFLIALHSVFGVI